MARAMQALGKAIHIEFEQAPGVWVDLDGLVVSVEISSSGYDQSAEFEIRGIVGSQGLVAFKPEKRYPAPRLAPGEQAVCRFCSSGWEASDARGNCRACGAPKGMALTRMTP